MEFKSNMPWWVKPVFYISGKGKHYKIIERIGVIADITIIFIIMGYSYQYVRLGIICFLLVNLWYIISKRWLVENEI